MLRPLAPLAVVKGGVGDAGDAGMRVGAVGEAVDVGALDPADDVGALEPADDAGAFDGVGTSGARAVGDATSDRVGDVGDSAVDDTLLPLLAMLLVRMLMPCDEDDGGGGAILGVSALAAAALECWQRHRLSTEGPARTAAARRRGRPCSPVRPCAVCARYP